VLNIGRMKFQSENRYIILKVVEKVTHSHDYELAIYSRWFKMSIIKKNAHCQSMCVFPIFFSYITG